MEFPLVDLMIRVELCTHFYTCHRVNQRKPQKMAGSAHIVQLPLVVFSCLGSVSP